MDNQAKRQVKMLLANFLYGFYIENIVSHLGQYGKFNDLFIETLRQTQQQAVTNMFQQTLKQIVTYVQQSLKNGGNTQQVQPQFAINLFTQIFYPSDCPQLNDNAQSDVLKMAMICVHKHMILCADTDRFLQQVKNYQKYKSEIIELLFQIVDYSSQECIQSFQKKFGKRVIQAEKPQLLNQYDKKEIIDQSDYKQKYNATCKDLRESKTDVQNLRKQVTQLQNQLQLIQESVKEQKKARDDMFQLKDAKIAALMQELLQLKQCNGGDHSNGSNSSNGNGSGSGSKRSTYGSKNSGKRTDSKQNVAKSKKIDVDAILSHIHSNNSKYSGSNNSEKDEKVYIDDDRADDNSDEDISINFSAKRDDYDVSYFNPNSILV